MAINFPLSTAFAIFIFSNMNTNSSFLLAIWPYASLYTITFLSGVSTHDLFSMYSEHKIWGKNCIVLWMRILLIILSNNYICYLVFLYQLCPIQG
jgi:hypothetical protein